MMPNIDKYLIIFKGNILEGIIVHFENRVPNISYEELEKYPYGINWSGRGTFSMKKYKEVWPVRRHSIPGHKVEDVRNIRASCVLFMRGM